MESGAVEILSGSTAGEKWGTTGSEEALQPLLIYVDACMNFPAIYQYCLRDYENVYMENESIVIPFFGKVSTILHFTQPFNWFCLHQLVTNQLFQSNFFFFSHHLSFKTNPSKINILYFVLQQFFLLCLIHLLLQSKDKVARPFEKIEDITDYKELWKIFVRVHHKWSVLTNNKEHVELVFIDANGTDIHVVISTMLKATFDTVLSIKDICIVTNFLPQPNDLMSKTTKYMFLIKFTRDTTMSNVNKHEIPGKKINFKPFLDIIFGKWKKDFLIDVIGMIENSAIHNCMPAVTP
ncbi:uncharacterized protein LOC127082636 [Lathyrus oleraceus]|uniref:uncharacterized protein LOC127082636 n=1 Tax=Pisum sativum TaxID=3888 RepID=UPI0021D2D500|nr:uncharacterized protein LOC127082636 [Pisum sativum]